MTNVVKEGMKPTGRPKRTWRVNIKIILIILTLLIYFLCSMYLFCVVLCIDCV